jgi:hypothetical protein
VRLSGPLRISIAITNLIAVTYTCHQFPPRARAKTRQPDAVSLIMFTGGYSYRHVGLHTTPRGIQHKNKLSRKKASHIDTIYASPLLRKSTTKSPMPTFHPLNQNPAFRLNRAMSSRAPFHCFPDVAWDGAVNLDNDLHGKERWGSNIEM